MEWCEMHFILISLFRAEIGKWLECVFCEPDLAQNMARRTGRFLVSKNNFSRSSNQLYDCHNLNCFSMSWKSGRGLTIPSDFSYHNSIITNSILQEWKKFSCQSRHYAALLLLNRATIQYSIAFAIQTRAEAFIIGQVHICIWTIIWATKSLLVGVGHTTPQQ